MRQYEGHSWPPIDSIATGVAWFGIAGSGLVNLDSQYRFLSGYYVGLAPLAWWIVPRIESETTVFRILCAAVFLGGLGRLLTLKFVGWPDTRILVVHAAELMFPLLVLWQNTISSRPRRRCGGSSSTQLPVGARTSALAMFANMMSASRAAAQVAGGSSPCQRNDDEHSRLATIGM